jgi:HK97 family phage major capsid protein
MLKNKNGDEVIEEEVIKTEEEVNAEAASALLAQTMEGATETVADAIVKAFEKKVKSVNAPVATIEKGVETRKFLRALASRDKAYLDEQQKSLIKNKAMNETVDADGGYLVPTELQVEVLRLANEGYGVARRDMRYLPFSGAANKRIIPKLGSSVNVFWTDEGAKKTGTTATFGVVTQTLKKLAAIVPLTEELFQDSVIDITSLVAELFLEAVVIEEDTQFFNGDGTVWLGILNTPTVPTIVTTYNNFAALTADDLLDLQYKVKVSARRKAKYYVASSIMGVIRKIKDLNGNYIFSAATSNGPATIFGKEVIELEAFPGMELPTANQKNKGFVLFADLKLGAIYGDKQSLRVKMLDQATITDADGTTVINLAEQDMIAMRVVQRCGFVITNEKAMAILKTKA